MAPDWKYKNNPADRSLKENLSIDTTFDPSYISWDTPFKSCFAKCVKWMQIYNSYMQLVI